MIYVVVMIDGGQEFTCSYCTTMELAWMAIGQLCDQHNKKPDQFYIDAVETDVW